jgi:hypothetical protein
VWNFDEVGEVCQLFYDSNSVTEQCFISSKPLKLPNGIFAGHDLPAKFKGSCQKPDFLWPIYHDSLGPDWTLSSTTGVRLWSDCIGEGKPFQVPEDGNDHSLNQVIISATASIYHQIALSRERPRVLAFTLNQTIIRFFIVTGERKEKVEGDEVEGDEGDDIWEVKYFHVNDRDLDLSIAGDCVRSLTLGTVLGEQSRQKLDEFNMLRRKKEELGLQMKKWWVENKIPKRSKQQAEAPAKDDDSQGGPSDMPDSKPGDRREGGGDSGGRKGKRRKGGDGLGDGEELGAKSWKGRTFALVMAMRKLSVSLLIVIRQKLML